MLTSAGRGARRLAAHAGRNRARRSRDSTRSRSCSARPSGRSSSSAARAGTRRRWHGCAAHRRGLGAAGRLLLPPPDAVRPSPPELCRRCRHRHQPEAGHRHQAGRPGAADRRPHGRDAVLRLHAAEEPLPRPDAGPCPCRRRRTRPRLPADAGDQRLACRLRRGLRQAQAGLQRRPGRTRPRDCTCRLSRLVDAAGNRPRRGPDGADHELSGKGAARRRHLHQRRRQLRHLGAPLPPLPPLRHAGRADLRLDGLRHAGRGRRQGALSRTAT